MESYTHTLEILPEQPWFYLTMYLEGQVMYGFANSPVGKIGHYSALFGIIRHWPNCQSVINAACGSYAFYQAQCYQSFQIFACHASFYG
jgi:hypothetical protein